MAWSAIRNRGPRSELSANFIVRCTKAAQPRFWPVSKNKGLPGTLLRNDSL